MLIPQFPQFQLLIPPKNNKRKKKTKEEGRNASRTDAHYAARELRRDLHGDHAEVWLLVRHRPRRFCDARWVRAYAAIACLASRFRDARTNGRAPA